QGRVRVNGGAGGMVPREIRASDKKMRTLPPRKKATLRGGHPRSGSLAIMSPPVPPALGVPRLALVRPPCHGRRAAPAADRRRPDDVRRALFGRLAANGFLGAAHTGPGHHTPPAARRVQITQILAIGDHLLVGVEQDDFRFISFAGIVAHFYDAAL